tara:strand:- start:342 stop:680 length:339 start_codon:yes stop_codon:yes gene_type:complete
LTIQKLFDFVGPKHNKKETNAEKLHLKSCFAGVRKNNLVTEKFLFKLKTEKRWLQRRRENGMPIFTWQSFRTFLYCLFAVSEKKNIKIRLGDGLRNSDGFRKHWVLTDLKEN